MPTYFILLKRLSSELSCDKVCFTDQNSKPLEIEDKINVTFAFKMMFNNKN